MFLVLFVFTIFSMIGLLAVCGVVIYDHYKWTNNKEGVK